MQQKIADHKRRVARLNRYVIVVAFLWLVTSFALLFLSGSRRSDSAGPLPPVLDHAVRTIAAVAVDSGAMPRVS